VPIFIIPIGVASDHLRRIVRNAYHKIDLLLYTTSEINNKYLYNAFIFNANLCQSSSFSLKCALFFLFFHIFSVSYFRELEEIYINVLALIWMYVLRLG
jgi:hypothetical protein